MTTVSLLLSKKLCDQTHQIWIELENDREVRDKFLMTDGGEGTCIPEIVNEQWHIVVKMIQGDTYLE